MKFRNQRTSFRQRRKIRGPGVARLAMLAVAVVTIFVVVDRCPATSVGAAGSTSSTPIAAVSITEAAAGATIASSASRAEPTISGTVTAPPGSLVHWQGHDVTDCEFAETTFAPLDGACLLPVDLAAQGTLQAERTRAGERERLTIKIGDYTYPEQHIQLEDTSRVNLSPANQERAASERQRIDAVWRRPTSRRFQLPLGSPLEKPGTANRFGARRVFNGEPRSPHTGADYKAGRGTPVLALADGTVVLAEEHFFGGNSVFIDHGDELISMSFHLDEIIVKAGEPVTRGAVIGTVGSTGRATGPHLHLGVRWHGQRIDPAALISGARAVVVVE